MSLEEKEALARHREVKLSREAAKRRCRLASRLIAVNLLVLSVFGIWLFVR